MSSVYVNGAKNRPKYQQHEYIYKNIPKFIRKEERKVM